MAATITVVTNSNADQGLGVSNLPTTGAVGDLIAVKNSSNSPTTASSTVVQTGGPVILWVCTVAGNGTTTFPVWNRVRGGGK